MNAIGILAAGLAAGGFIATAASGAIEPIPEQRAREIGKAAPAQPSVKPKQPRRVLIFVTPPHLMGRDPHKGYCIPYGAAAFTTLGEKTGAYQPVVSDDLAMWLPQNLERFDAVVLNNASGPWITPTEEQLASGRFRELGASAAEVERKLRASLLDYVANGGGLVAIHYASGGNRHWPGFAELLGATMTGHPWNEEIGVTVEEPDHPLVAAWGGNEFRIADEIFQFGEPYDRGKVRVLLSLDPATTNMGVRWIRRTDNDFALAWVKQQGRGRVFYTSFGHRTEIYFDPRVLRFYLDAVQFATGDLEAPAEPRAGAPQRGIPGTDPVPGLPGFVSLFNGRDLAGWDGDPRIWSVRDGAITGETTPDVRVEENTFLVWKDELENFELRLKFRLEGGNSGVYYRARKRRPGQQGEALVGPQADISADGRWTGVIMEYTLRDVLAERGQAVRIDDHGERVVTGSVGDPADLLALVKPGEWNDYRVVADSTSTTLEINGVVMCRLDDDDPQRPDRGWLGLQVHQGPPMRVQFKEIALKRL